MADSHENSAEKYTILEEADVPGAKLKIDPEKCIVEELKRWGKKDELVSRVKDAMKWISLSTQILMVESGMKLRREKLKIMLFLQSYLYLPKNFNYGHVYFFLFESIASQLMSVIPVTVIMIHTILVTLWLQNPFKKGVTCWKVDLWLIPKIIMTN